MAEQWTLNPLVLGSNPRGRTKKPQHRWGFVAHNPMDVTVEVSAANAAPQTVTVQKDKSGDEVADWHRRFT